MAESSCARCTFRARFDRDPRSLLGRLWRWHINFCPGWRKYVKSLPKQEKMSVVDRYGFPPDKFA